MTTSPSCGCWKLIEMLRHASPHCKVAAVTFSLLHFIEAPNLATVILPSCGDEMNSFTNACIFCHLSAFSSIEFLKNLLQSYLSPNFLKKFDNIYIYIYNLMYKNKTNFFAVLLVHIFKRFCLNEIDWQLLQIKGECMRISMKRRINVCYDIWKGKCVRMGMFAWAFGKAKACEWACLLGNCGFSVMHAHVCSQPLHF